MRVDSKRLKARFVSLKKNNKPGLISFITAGDPEIQTSKLILQGLPEAGTDIIELGMPFSDPMADGPTIQASSQRALKNGQTMALTLEMVQKEPQRIWVPQRKRYKKIFKYKNISSVKISLL